MCLTSPTPPVLFLGPEVLRLGLHERWETDSTGVSRVLGPGGWVKTEGRGLDRLRSLLTDLRVSGRHL